MKLNCLTLDVDTCQLSSFSVLRPWRQNSTVSSALVKTLALTPQNSFPVSLPIPAHPTGVDCLRLQAYYTTAKGKSVQHFSLPLPLFKFSSYSRYFLTKGANPS